MNGWVLPRSAVIGGADYEINADFRDILDIIAAIQDEQEPERTRTVMALALFYEGFDRMPRGDYPEAIGFLMRFISGGEDEDEAAPRAKTFDWEQDRGLIVADINKVAGCEVRALEFCHWWTFLSWFNAIGEGQLSAVVSIREKRRKGKKLEQWEREFYQENKARVDFKKKYTDEELREQARIKGLLGE